MGPQKHLVISKIKIAQASKDGKYLLQFHPQVYIKLGVQLKFVVMTAIC